MILRTFSHTLRVLLSVLFFLFSGGCGGTNAAEKDVIMSDILMGTFVRVKIRTEGKMRERAEMLSKNAFGLAARLETVFSIFDPESEISALNLSGGGNASTEMLDVLVLAREIGESTDGKFDITIAPVLKKMGFYGEMPERLVDSIPNGTDGVGWKNVGIDEARGTVALQNGAWIDLSGIAKGHIADRMSELLGSGGIGDFIVDAGGDMCCRSSRPEGWIIGVRDPRGQNIALKLRIGSGAVATSGDYENVMPGEDGGLVSHIVDTDTDKVIERLFYSVTVIANTCATADAFATAFMTYDPNEAVAVADRTEGIDVIIIDERDGHRVIRMSLGAGRYVL